MFKNTTFASHFDWSGARVAELARLESEYASKAHPEFESRSLRKARWNSSRFFVIYQQSPILNI